MDLTDQLVQLRQLGVPAGVPITTDSQDTDQGAGVGEQVLSEIGDEEVAGQPLEAGLEGAAEAGVRHPGAGAEVGLGAQAQGWSRGKLRFVAAFFGGTPVTGIFFE
jgi:hypothetical protein